MITYKDNVEEVLFHRLHHSTELCTNFIGTWERDNIKIMERYSLALVMIFMVSVCDGASFLFFHSPEPMSHATVLHTVAR